LLQLFIISLGIVNADGSNEDAVSRGKRAFPSAKHSNCTFEKEALADVVEILKAVNQTNGFTAEESTKIFQSVSSKYGSVGECDILINSILANCKDIIDLRKNGQSGELEEKLQELQLNLDNVDRSAKQMEANLRREYENSRAALKLELRQSELERRENERRHEKAVMKLVIMQLQNNHVDTAHDEFVALKYRDELAEEFVQSAYSDSRVNLAQLAKFVCRINIFNTGYIGINALYKEMAKHNQLEEKQMILLYYRLKNLEMDDQFASILPELKANYYALVAKMLPYIKC